MSKSLATPNTSLRLGLVENATESFLADGGDHRPRHFLGRMKQNGWANKSPVNKIDPFWWLMGLLIIRSGPAQLHSYLLIFFQKYHLYKSKFVKGGPFFPTKRSIEDQFYSRLLLLIEWAARDLFVICICFVIVICIWVVTFHFYK
jgi:hypothetical protein